MPELPEVETVKNGLTKYLSNKTILAVDYDWDKSFPNSKGYVDNYLIEAKILKLRRRGKALIIDLDSGYSLLIHLKMTGQLVYKGKDQKFGAGHPNDSLVGSLPDKSTRVTIKLSDDNQNISTLFFNDQRKFGWMRLVPTIEVENINFMKKLGPEPLEPTTTSKVFKQRLLRRKNSGIKAVLLDQTVIAGIGNIYADECLWMSKIHPETRTGSLSDAAMNKLFVHIKQVFTTSINSGGSTDKNYVNADGQKGSYLKFAKVFRREGQPCERCGSEIIKIKVAGRGTHICPKCQRLKK
ncbi:bifunctional DNA-formamidopyrimidine glycosylase/DNA-(apurinic or apyrimidinic site) lyase [Candidatus Saccharibacteria bacterium]|nr:bifunctional DNA-formamidopyrimidine glycosylase/DNA-(apurinic or apyrimidinic site) lyase [Candidatus Saccharibacteria bacterium]